MTPDKDTPTFRVVECAIQFLSANVLDAAVLRHVGELLLSVAQRLTLLGNFAVQFSPSESDISQFVPALREAVQPQLKPGRSSAKETGDSEGQMMKGG
eukprot:2958043-Rhodomonas_salina.1